MDLKARDKKKTFWIEHSLILTEPLSVPVIKDLITLLFGSQYLFYLRSVQWGNDCEILLLSIFVNLGFTSSGILYD